MCYDFYNQLCVEFQRDTISYLKQHFSVSKEKMDMEYTGKKEDLVKTTRELRHETKPETYIPKDTIVQIIGIEPECGYRFRELDFCKELI